MTYSMQLLQLYYFPKWSMLVKPCSKSETYTIYAFYEHMLLFLEIIMIRFLDLKTFC